MNSLELEGESHQMHATNTNEENLNGFLVMSDQEENRNEIWIDNDQDNDDLLHLNEASMFYTEFPPLPDFPCMSSSSSSSSIPVAIKPMASSSSSSSASSSAASSDVLKSEAEEDLEKKKEMNYTFYDPVLDATPAALSSTASMDISQPSDHGQGLENCMDVMDTFGYMDLLESNDFFDPSSLFENGQNPLEDFQQEDLHQNNNNNYMPQTENAQDLVFQQQQHQGGDQMMMGQNNNKEDNNIQMGETRSELDDMSMVFFEWLKTNRESVSADDLRNVKFRKETIECAAKRLGGGKQAMKQLLKLVLQWVQTNHLKKMPKESQPSLRPANQYQNPNPNPDPNNINLNSNSLPHETNPACFNTQQWMTQQPPPAYDPTSNVVVAPPPSYPSPMVRYVDDPSPFANATRPYVSQSQTDQYNMIDTVQTWASPQFTSMACSPYTSYTDNNNLQPQTAQTSYASNYGTNNQHTYTPYYQAGRGDQVLMRLGTSATKEARKKRMARQRRLFSHHRHHHHYQQQFSHNQQNQHQNQSVDPHARLVTTSDNCTQANPSNWVYWPSVAGGVPSASTVIHGVLADQVAPIQSMDRSVSQVAQNHQGRVAASEKRQGWKPEKNLKFLLQKVLKQSDVGNLGRIVLPKKEAETHLPELDTRDGMNIAMEDIGTSRVWNMRYRYWPNNKSRMYLLENTGDFVKANELQEGDFIVIYSDTKCNKYMIRGVRVRQAGPNSENKGAGKSQRNQHTTTPAGLNGSSNSPITTTHRKLY